jgi:ABC-2 type transport system permease protein
MKQYLSKQNRTLLSELVRTDFKLRYQGSVLGYTWSLLRPLLIFVILFVVFVKFLKIGNSVPHYPVYLLLGIVVWNFFVEMTSQSLGSIVGRGDLIRKIRIPRWIVVFSSSIILIEVYLFALGISLFLAAAFVKFRDVGYIWEVILQAGFYLTPILYPLALITNLTLQKLIFLNPMAQAIQDIRYSVVTHETVTIWRVFDGGWYALAPFIVVIAVLVGGLMYFKSQADSFAENI